MPLIKRLVKGSPLTFQEGDDNLDYLENLALNPFPYSGSAVITGSLTITGSTGVSGSTLVLQRNSAVTSSFITALDEVGRPLFHIRAQYETPSFNPAAASIFIGYYSGQNITASAAIRNTALGGLTLASLTTGDSNVAIGQYALRSLLTGNFNTGIGERAAPLMTSGEDNTIVGNGAGSYRQSGSFNVIIGSNAMQYYAGNSNTAIGVKAGDLSSGDYNIFIGRNSGTQVVTGSYNVVIGSNNGATLNGLNNHILFADGQGNERFRITNTGEFLIGTTTTGSYKFQVNGTSNFRNNVDITGSLNVSGSINVNGTITATTLVVQTITSSQSWITGSTKFGNDLSNTHQFTGSVDVTGSLGVKGGIQAGAFSLGTTAGNKTSRILASDFTATNNVTYSFVGYRTANGSDWFTSALGINLNVDATDQGVITYITRTGNVFANDGFSTTNGSFSAGSDAFGGVFKNINAGGTAGGIPTAAGGFAMTGTSNANISNYGVYINNTSTVSGTGRKWGLYSNAGTNYFNDNILIGTTTDAGQKLQVNGTALITGAASIDDITIAKSSNFSLRIGRNVSTAAIGDGNTLIGANSAEFSSTGAYRSNTVLGRFANQYMRDGDNNVAIGVAALAGDGTQTNFNANQNTAVGVSSILNVRTGAAYNSAFGNRSGIGLTTGTYNTFIGANDNAYTGSGITTGNYNVLIGSQITGLTSSLSNTIILADGQGNQRIRVSDAGNTMIATTTDAGYKLYVSGSGTSGSLNVDNTLHVNSSRNVLIGTTTDAGYKLDVNGTARIQSNLRIGGVAAASENITFGGGGIYSQTIYFDGSLTTWIQRPGQNGLRYYSAGNHSFGVSTTLEALNIGVNGTIINAAYSSLNTSAVLQVDSTTKGFLPPRMTLAQRTAISSPVGGLIVYETGSLATEGIWLYESTGWQQVLTNTGSLSISGSVTITGSLNASSITGSLLGTASFATTASYALSTVQPTSGKVIYVDASSPNATNTRGSLSKYNLTYPFSTIQAAVNAAASGDSIWVYPGTYNESVAIGASGSVTLNLLLYSGVTINGGSSFAIYSGTGSQCGLNLDMMPNSIVRNTGNASDPSGSAVLLRGSNSGINLTGVGNPLAKSKGAGAVDYTTGNPSIISTNAYCMYGFGNLDFNGEKASGVTFYSQNSIPIYNPYGGMVYENCVINAPNNYGVSGIVDTSTFINCLIVTGKTCYYNSNGCYAHLINCDLYSTNEYGIFGTNDLRSRVIINDCRINSFSQSILLSSNNTAPLSYEICNNVMGSRNLASSTIVSISDTNVNSVGIFSNNVVNKSTVTLPSTISEFNTYVTNDVSGSIPYIIT